MASNRIETDRLCLRQLQVEEGRELLQGRADPERPWMSGYPIQGTLIAVEAFVRAVDSGAQPGVVRVEADTTHANLPSQRVMERAGMRLVDRNEQLRFYRIP